MEKKDEQDCLLTIQRIQQLLGSGIFQSENAGHVLAQSAYIDLVICLRDLLYKAEKYAARVDFTDDLVVNAYVKDVTDAVTAHRDAACHIDSFKRVFDVSGSRGAFNVAYGKVVLMQLGDQLIASEYDDDVAIFYGANRLYLQRHIIRAFNEATERLAPLMKFYSV